VHVSRNEAHVIKRRILVNTTLERSIVKQPLHSLVNHVIRKANLYGVVPPRVEDISSANGYRIGGISLDGLIDAVNSFGKRFTVCNESNKIWGEDDRVEHFSTKESPTFYPLDPGDFRRHVQFFSSRSGQEQEEICQKNGGKMVSVEEFFDFLIDYLFHSLQNDISPLKRINELIYPSATPGEQRTSCMIRCRNMLYPQNPQWSLCIRLTRDGSVGIVDWPLKSATADVGSLCTWYTE